MGDLIDKGLAFGGGFDWITPVLGIVGDVVHGGGHTFAVSASSLWDARYTLRRAKVGYWGCMVRGDSGAITVKQQDAGRAQEALAADGIEVLGGAIWANAGRGQAKEHGAAAMPRRKGRWL